MHLTRTQAIRELPIQRKGTKYIARALSHVREGIPVVIAIRDILKLAHTSREVKKMINQGLIKINGRVVKDLKESIRLFNILEADKSYKLKILPTRRFYFEETNDKSRLCKVIKKTLLNMNRTQLNLHDGTNVLLSEKKEVKIGDSIELDLNNKIKKIISLEKGRDVFIISGKSVGLTGKIENINKKIGKIKIDGVNREVELNIAHIMVK